jgi:putative ABC transport system permease protein
LGTSPVSDEGGPFEAVGYYANDLDKVLENQGVFKDLSNARVSRDFFKLFHVSPAKGRLFTDEDFRSTFTPTVLLSHATWITEFGGDPRALGSTIRFNDGVYQIVGILPESFRFPEADVDVWFPDSSPFSISSTEQQDKRTLGLVRKHISTDQVRAALSVATDRLTKKGQIDTAFVQGFFLTAVPLLDEIVGPTKKILLYFLLAVGLIQFVVCLNISTLLVVRNSSRMKQVAIRHALGASRLRLIGEDLADGFFLAVLGGMAGLTLCYIAFPLMRTTMGMILGRTPHLSMSWNVLFFSTATVLLSLFLFSVAPALQLKRAELDLNIKGLYCSPLSPGAILGEFARKFFVVLQLAVAIVLLAAFTLLFRSLWSLMNVDVGFNPNHLLGIQLDASQSYLQKMDTFLPEIVSQLRAVPNVQGVAISSIMPLNGLSFGTLFSANTDSGWVVSPRVRFQAVSQGYFEMLGIPILAGRSILEEDRKGHPCVVVLNAWRGTNPVGRRIDLNLGMGTPYYCQVVGVVGDMRDLHLESPPQPEVFFSYAQRNAGSNAVLVKWTGSSPPSFAVLKERLIQVEPSLQIGSMALVSDTIAQSVSAPRVRSIVLGFFAIVAIVSAAIGIYGITSYATTLRNREIGIRIALGAHPWTIRAMIIRDSLQIAAWGLSLGIVGSYVARRIFVGLLDAEQFIGFEECLLAGIIVIAIVAIASAIPTYKASHVDPAKLLREE